MTATTAMESLFRRKDGRVKDSYSLKRYVNGQSVTHTQWDDEQPDWYDAAFEEWLENRSKTSTVTCLGTLASV